jgi:GNAT superfamily N-acetyltransferase
MSQITYRELRPHEADLLGTIDRSELVEGIYRRVGGELQLEAVRQRVASWAGSELDGYVSRLRTVMASGGRAHAAWHASRLVGIGSLALSGSRGVRTLFQLDMLYVSAEFRGRGIGRQLTRRVAGEARSLGATTLYISATPTRGTVDAYLRMGAELVTHPDPELFAREPEDIHLLLPLR